MWTFGAQGDQDGLCEVALAPEFADAAEFARVRLGIEPDPLQVKVLQASSKRVILNCARQWGKSVTAAMLAVHRAYTQEDSLIVVASPSRRQSAELMDKITRMLTQAGIAHSGDGINVPSAVLRENGSRIVGLPGRDDTTRGFSAVSLLLIDEAAQVRDAMFKTLTPMLAVTNGDL